MDKHNGKKHSNGHAIILVMVAMVVLMALGSALIQHFVVVEEREVEESLAESRARLAMTGFLRYLVNRTQRLEFTSDASKITRLRDILSELNGITMAGATMIRVDSAVQINAAPLAWRVPISLDYANPVSGGGVYRIKTQVDIIDAVNGTDNGDLRLEFTLTAPDLSPGETLIPLLAALPNRFPGLSCTYNTMATTTGRITRSTY